MKLSKVKRARYIPGLLDGVYAISPHWNVQLGENLQTDSAPKKYVLKSNVEP